MSIILNALRKSEQERQAIPTETLEDKILVKQESVLRNKPGWVIALVAINSLVLAFFIWHFIMKDKIDQEPVLPIESTTKPSDTITKKQPALQIKLKVGPSQPTIAEKINKDRLKKNDHKRNQQALLKPPPVIQSTKVDLPTKKEIEKISKPQQEYAKKTEPLSTNIDDEPPYLSEMSYDFRRSVPNININVFVYSENPQDRFIMVNMQKFQTGDEIEKEVELQEIRSNSIVVEYQDKVFQIQR